MSELERALSSAQKKRDEELSLNEAARVAQEELARSQIETLKGVEKEFAIKVKPYIQTMAARLVPKELLALCEETAKVFSKKTGILLQKETEVYYGSSGDIDSTLPIEAKQQLLEGYNSGELTESQISFMIKFSHTIDHGRDGAKTEYSVGLGVENRWGLVNSYEGVYARVGHSSIVYDGSHESLEQIAEMFGMMLTSSNPTIGFGTAYGGSHEPSGDSFRGNEDGGAGGP